jgi:hypothetical protein
MLPAPPRAQVASFMRECEGLAILNANAKSTPDWDENDGDATEAQLYFYDWMKRRLDDVQNLVEARMLTKPGPVCVCVCVSFSSFRILCVFFCLFYFAFY